MRIVRTIFWLCILLVGLIVIYQPSTTLAQDKVEEKVRLSSTYPNLEGTWGTPFEFEVVLQYQGSEDRYFDILVTGPRDWVVFITSDEGKRIRGMTLDPEITWGRNVKVKAYPRTWLAFEPGEYKITLEAISGEISDTIELKAMVTDIYVLGLVPSEALHNITVTAGKDNHFSIKVANRGTGAIDNINLSSSAPTGTTGWRVEFSPSKVDSLAFGDFQTIDVNIKPPPRTIAGDYYPLTLRAFGDQTTAEKLEIRVIVETPAIWGWVGVGIIVLVIVGLGVIFMRFSRR